MVYILWERFGKGYFWTDFSAIILTLGRYSVRVIIRSCYCPVERMSGRAYVYVCGFSIVLILKGITT